MKTKILKQIKKLLRKHLIRRHLRLIVATSGGMVLFGASVALAHYAMTPITLSYHLDHIPVSSAIKVSFNQTIDPHLNYNLQPGLKGTWKTESNIAGVTAIVFTPEHPLTPGSTYKLMVGHVQKLGDSKPEIDETVIPISVEPPADVKAVSPGNGSVNIPVTAGVSVTLKAPNHDLRHLKLTSDAPVALRDLGSKDEKVFHWAFASALAQGTTYHLYLDDLKQADPSKRRLSTTSFTTVPEPHVATATQTDHFYPGNTIDITFDQPMRQTDGAITFGMPGSGHWQSPTTYGFTPTGLKPGSSYTYTVHKNAASTAGGVVQEDHNFTISPPGAAFVTGSSPHGSNLGLGTSISFSFDQPVDHASAQAAFSIAPAVNGSFSWSGNTMNFHPAGLAYQTGYTASLRPGIQSTYGLPSVASFSTSFSTTYEVIKLGVPLFHQAYTLSCEAASLRMALAFRGIGVNDYDILNAFGYAPRPRDTGSNSWDNPYQMYVGDANGVMSSTGWGVYSPPVAAAAQHFGRGASAVTGISANTVAQAIHNGNPVVLWGINGSSVRPDSWNTNAGVVSAPHNEHVRTVYGVAGSAANPIGFYLNDPIYGTLYWTTGQLIYNMTFGGSGASQGVIVY